MNNFLDTINNSSMTMEEALFNYSKNKNFEFIGPFENKNNIKRGDGSVINPL
jgi:hypothetical protein